MENDWIEPIAIKFPFKFGIETHLRQFFIEISLSWRTMADLNITSIDWSYVQIWIWYWNGL